MEVLPGTKKEQILVLARRDPFLKIEEIAAKVDTTPRYVRTTLSEAKISLMQLRRSYARHMEKRLGIDAAICGDDPGLTPGLASAGKELAVNEIRVHKMKQRYWAELLGVAEDEQLLTISRIRFVDGEPFFVSQIVTTGELSLSEEMLRGDKPLRELLGLVQPGATEFGGKSVEVEQADPTIAASLGILPGEPVMRSGNLIITHDRPVGLEFNIFPAYSVRFVLVGDGDYDLKVVGKTG